MDSIRCPDDSVVGMRELVMIKIKKGLDLPIGGAPEQVIHEGPAVRSVAVLGPDYIGMHPTMRVTEGERVKCGQLLFTDKKNPGVKFTAPAAGMVSAIQRGSRRSLRSVVIDLDGDEAESFPTHASAELDGLARDAVRTNLIESGLWTAIRTRPYSRVPPPDSEPKAIFVTAMDSNPLAPAAALVVGERPEAFQDGLRILARLTDGPVHVCKAPGDDIPVPASDRIRVTEFDGPHPAGLAGTHIHFLEPVGPGKTVWHLGYQDVMAIGELFTTGRLSTERVVALAGPLVKSPRLLRTRLGANLDELTEGELHPGEHRIISGSVFCGHIADGPKAFLGRYHTQASVLLEDREKRFFGWIRPGGGQFSVTRAYTAHLRPGARFDLTTTTNGSARAMMPIGTFERVMPLDILPTQLLRALITQDTDLAQDLGCLELDEEDLALCTFVCPGKHEYGPLLRENLTRIEQEG
jgi:Na+-transporting NADH:ubiquinone oxidoreductase subunit A